MSELNQQHNKPTNTKIVYSSTFGVKFAHNYIEKAIHNSKLHLETGKKLSELHVRRGGVHGQKGFVFEELHATRATISGQPTNVLNNNSVADFSIIQPNGTIKLGQAKAGYANQKVDFSPYKDQVVIVDKGNQNLINQAKLQKQKIIESDISLSKAEKLSKLRQLEGKVTGKTTAPIVSKSNALVNVAKESHVAGLKASKGAAMAGFGFSAGSNLVDVVTGDKTVKEAGIEVVKDTAVATGVGYVAASTITAVGSTASGAAVMGAATTAATTATAAITSTTAGAAVVGAGAATVGAIGAAGTAVATSAVGAAAAAGSAIGGAAVGTAIAGSAIATATIAAAPVVAVAVVAGIGVKLISKLFRR